MSNVPLSPYQIRKAWKKNDPWRGEKTTSIGRVAAIGTKVPSHITDPKMRVQSLVATICVEPEKAMRGDEDERTFDFVLPETMRKQQRAMPEVGQRILFVHHQFLGVRRIRDFTTIREEEPQQEETLTLQKAIIPKDQPTSTGDSLDWVDDL